MYSYARDMFKSAELADSRIILDEVASVLDSTDEAVVVELGHRVNEC